MCIMVAYLIVHMFENILTCGRIGVIRRIVPLISIFVLHGTIYRHPELFIIFPWSPSQGR